MPSRSGIHHAAKRRADQMWRIHGVARDAEYAYEPEYAYDADKRAWVGGWYKVRSAELLRSHRPTNANRRGGDPMIHLAIEDQKIAMRQKQAMRRVRKQIMRDHGVSSHEAQRMIQAQRMAAPYKVHAHTAELDVAIARKTEAREYRAAQTEAARLERVTNFIKTI